MCRTVIKCCGTDTFILVNQGAKNSVRVTCRTCGASVKVRVYGKHNNKVVYGYYKDSKSKRPYKIEEFKKRG